MRSRIDITPPAGNGKHDTSIRICLLVNIDHVGPEIRERARRESIHHQTAPGWFEDRYSKMEPKPQHLVMRIQNGTMKPFASCSLTRKRKVSSTKPFGRKCNKNKILRNKRLPCQGKNGTPGGIPPKGDSLRLVLDQLFGSSCLSVCAILLGFRSRRRLRPQQSIQMGQVISELDLRHALASPFFVNGISTPTLEDDIKIWLSLTAGAVCEAEVAVRNPVER